MKEILANTEYGFTTFKNNHNKFQGGIDLSPMEFPLWLVLTVLLFVGGSILLLPLPFKLISLVALVALL